MIKPYQKKGGSGGSRVIGLFQITSLVPRGVAYSLCSSAGCCGGLDGFTCAEIRVLNWRKFTTRGVLCRLGSARLIIVMPGGLSVIKLFFIEESWLVS